jgi:hypothetical protein
MFFSFSEIPTMLLVAPPMGGMGNGRSKLEGKKTYMLVFKTGNAASLDLHMHRYIYIKCILILCTYIHIKILYIYMCKLYLLYIFFSKRMSSAFTSAKLNVGESICT